MVNMIQNTTKRISLRECSRISKIANKYNSDIFLLYNDKKVNAKSMIGLIQLCIEPNRIVMVNLHGKDEHHAYLEMKKVLRSM
jgi:phosphotransferase system HPr (HPr) family protein